MQTRIERYKIYRNEIANESTLISKVAVNSKAINIYRERINRIDLTILENMNLDRNLLKLVSINQRSANESETMVHFLNIIEEKKMINIKEEIDTTLAKYTYEPIMAPNGQISASWLRQDATHSNFAKTSADLDALDSNWSDFKKDSSSQIKDINELAYIKNNNAAIQQLKSINEYRGINKNFNKILYIVPSLLSVILLITVVILLIVEIIGIK